MLATLIPHRTTENLPEQGLFQTFYSLFVTAIGMKSIKAPHDGQYFLIPCHHFTLDIFLLNIFAATSSIYQTSGQDDHSLATAI